MKKTMIFESVENFENWYNENEKNGLDFLDNRLTAVKRTTDTCEEGTFLTGYDCEMTIRGIKKLETAMKKMIAELRNAGIDDCADALTVELENKTVYGDEIKPFHGFVDCGYEFNFEYLIDGWYVRIAVIQNEIKIEKTEETVETEEPQQETEIITDTDRKSGIKKAIICTKFVTVFFNTGKKERGKIFDDLSLETFMQLLDFLRYNATQVKQYNRLKIFTSDIKQPAELLV